MIDPSTLNRVEDLKGLADDDRAALAERMRQTAFEKDQVLVRMLEKVQRVLLLLEGLAGLETVSVNGVRRIVWVFQPGDLIGSRALLAGRVDHTEVRALTPGEAAVLSADDLERIAGSRPEVGLAITRILTERLHGMAERLLDATTLDVSARLAQLLLDFAGAEGDGGDGYRPLAYPMTHETMAEIVGASRPHVSATIGEMEGVGALRRGRGGKLVVHPETLERLLETKAQLPV